MSQTDGHWYVYKAVSATGWTPKKKKSLWIWGFNILFIRIAATGAFSPQKTQFVCLFSTNLGFVDLAPSLSPTNGFRKSVFGTVP